MSHRRLLNLTAVPLMCLASVNSCWARDNEPLKDCKQEAERIAFSTANTKVNLILKEHEQISGVSGVVGGSGCLFLSMMVGGMDMGSMTFMCTVAGSAVGLGAYHVQLDDVQRKAKQEFESTYKFTFMREKLACYEKFS
jgi:hypothetical protein